MTDSYLSTENHNLPNNMLISKLTNSLKEKRLPKNNNNTIIYSSFSKGKPEQRNSKINDSSTAIESKKIQQNQEEDIDYLKLFSEKNKNNYEATTNRTRKSKFFYSNRIPKMANPTKTLKIIQNPRSSNFSQIPQKTENQNINFNRRAMSSEALSAKSKYNSSTESAPTPPVKNIVKNNVRQQKSLGSRNINNIKINRKKIPLPMNNGYSTIHATVTKINRIKNYNNLNEYENNRTERHKIANKYNNRLYYGQHDYTVFNTINGMYDNSNITTDNLNLSHQLNLNHNKKGISQLTNLNNLVIEDKENIAPNNSYNYNTILNNSKISKIPLNMKLYRNDNNIINGNTKQKISPLTQLNNQQYMKKMEIHNVPNLNLKKQKNYEKKKSANLNINTNVYNENINKNNNITNNNNVYKYSVIENYDDFLINDLINQNMNNLYQEHHEKHEQHNSKLGKIPLPHHNKNQNINLDKNNNNDINNIILDNQNIYNSSINTIEIPENKIINNNATSHPIQNAPHQTYIETKNNNNENEKFHFPTIQKPVRKDSNNSNITYNVFDGSGWLKNYAVFTHPGCDKNGNQKTNQDSFVFKTNINNIKNFNIFGVMDGHGPQGHYVSQFASKFIPFQIINHRDLKNLKNPEDIYQKLKDNEYEIIDKIFMETDNQLTKVNFDATESGCTCVLIINIGKHIICANTGDSRAILIYDTLGQNNYNDYVEMPLSYDYKPEMPEEKQRIEECGGVVEQLKTKNGEGVGPYRVWKQGEGYPGLAMSRSIGDLIGKKIGVIPNPGLLEYDLNESVKFIVVCSDGVWEFLENDNVKNIGIKYYKKKDPNGYCHELVKNSYKLWKENGICVDDITAVAAFF